MDGIDVEKIHTTGMGLARIAKNIGMPEAEALAFCRAVIAGPGTDKERRGKNWYFKTDGVEITVNASSLTVITAHRRK